MENSNHTFAVCAYKESPHLEACIRSLKNQSFAGNILLATSTSNSFIENIAKKYKIPYYVRDGKSGITQDWNFAISVRKKTITVTLSLSPIRMIFMRRTMWKRCRR